jgi:hypothetical protein
MGSFGAPRGHRAVGEDLPAVLGERADLPAFADCMELERLVGEVGQDVDAPVVGGRVGGSLSDRVVYAVSIQTTA